MPSMAQIPNRNIHKSSDISTKLVEALGDHVNALRSQNELSIVELEAKANALINELACDQKDVYEVVESSLRLHRVLKAMLDNANIFDGEDSLKYAAAAICACARTVDGKDFTLQNLRNLALTWLSHFLYLFKSTCSHLSQKNVTPSPAATPTLDYTQSILAGEVHDGSRLGSLRQQILERDGHQCCVSSLKGEGHPLINTQDLGVSLQCAHIIRRAVGVIGAPDSQRFKASSSQCFDILRNYCGLGNDILEGVNNIIDYPMNGFMLWVVLHETFDKFMWTLIPVEGDNKYKVKDYRPTFSGLKFVSLASSVQIEDIVVEFKDHREELARLNGKPMPPAIPLPDPLFFKIHAAIAGILHMSGAGKFLDELFTKFDRDRDSTSVLSFDEVVDEVVRRSEANQFGEEFR
ncbi:hypothetical protein BDN72DRAFT_965648, partial [Pluteus cervinus]